MDENGQLFFFNEVIDNDDIFINFIQIIWKKEIKEIYFNLYKLVERERIKINILNLIIMYNVFIFYYERNK